MPSRRFVLVTAGLAALAIPLTACATAEPGEIRGTAPPEEFPLDTAGVAQAAGATEALAWTLLAGKTGNRVLGPSSLMSAIAMLGEGAAGASAASLDSTIGLAGDERSAAVAALRQALAGYDTLPDSVDKKEPPEEIVVHQASQVVILDEAIVEEAFLDRLSRFYDSGVARVDRDEAKAVLDAWAKKHTAGLIEKSAIEVTPDLQLVLQDAVLFAARWRTPFTSEWPVPFTPTGGAPTEVPGMAEIVPARFAEGSRWSAVRLPYDDVLAMDVILPSPGVAPSELTVDELVAVAEGLEAAGEGQVSVVMPTSDQKQTWDLLQPVQEAGIVLSDLSMILPGGALGQLVQQVTLTVSPKGTVGAVLTEGAVGTGMPSYDAELWVDRPYVMRVLDTRTRWPIFLAIVEDPAAPSE
ncbi:serpin family protein [Tessaracoccus sp. Y1736]